MDTMQLSDRPISDSDPSQSPYEVLRTARAVRASFSSVYGELRKLARHQLRRGSSGNTLYTTELVHEAYVKVCMNESLAFDSDVKFYRYAALTMRHILIDRATRRARAKFGGDRAHTDMNDPELDEVAKSPVLALQLDAALRQLEREDPRAAKVVELHYFAGLPLDKVGELLGIARRTADRDWAFARAFLEANMPEDAGSTY